MSKVEDDNSVTSLLVNQKISYRLTGYRWVALGLACMTMVGSYFCYDNPSALQSAMTSEFGLTTNQANFEVNWYYSIYSIPNMILPFFGGLLIDKIGVRVGVFCFSTILIFGQALFTYGGYQQSFTIMLLGRLVFGFGGESLSVAQSTITAQWFQDKERAFAMGFNIAVARLGSGLNAALSPTIASATGHIWPAQLLGLGLTVVSVCTGLGLCYMDKISDIREGKAEGAKVGDKMSWEDLKSFTSLYWLLVVDCLLIYAAYFAFTNNANNILNLRFGFDTTDAGYILLILYVIAAIVTPIFGRVVDKIGKRAYLMQISISLLMLGHAMVAFFPDSTTPTYIVILPLLCFGVFYATYAAVIWPCYPLVVEERTLGTAFGIVTAFQNAFLFLAPLLVGVINNATPNDDFGYFWTEIFLFGMGALGFCCNIMVNIVDKQTGSALNKRPPTGEEPRKSALSSFGKQ
jgi:MFS family permease